MHAPDGFLTAPTAGLDPASRRELIATLAGLDVAQLLVTHDLPMVLELCPRTVLVDGGRVVADGSTDGPAAALVSTGSPTAAMIASLARTTMEAAWNPRVSS